MTAQTVYFNKQTICKEPCVATIGFFDGVHLGHMHVIKQVVEVAKRKNIKSMVITFDVHPRQVVQPSFVPLLITSFEQKIELLKQSGVDFVVVLPFNKDLANVEAFDFMKFILKKQLNVNTLVIGYDNRFGKRNGDTFDNYVNYGKTLNIEVCEASKLQIENELTASSSHIRLALEQGNVRLANELLNRLYWFKGIVAHGFQEGRKIGYPTANIVPLSEQTIVPGGGVYAVRLFRYKTQKWHNGMLSIGTRPTYGEFKQTIEVNIFDFCEDIYNEEVALAFVKRTRSEVKFDSIEQLKQKLANDEQEIRSILLNYNTNIEVI